MQAQHAVLCKWGLKFHVPPLPSFCCFTEKGGTLHILQGVLARTALIRHQPPFPVQNRDKFHSSRAGCWLVTNRFLADDHLFDADDLRDVVDHRFELAVAKTLIDASQQLGVHVAAAVDACTATDQMSHDELLTALSRVCTSAKTQPTAKGV